MKNLKMILAGFMLLAFTFNAQSQCRNPQRLEQIKSQKVAFYTTKLNLSPAEAEKFWPVYNEMDTKIFDIQCRMRDIIRDNRTNGSKKTEKELSDMVNEILKLQGEEQSIRIDYNKKISSILTPAKAILYFDSEYAFKKELMKQARQRDAKGPRQD